MTQTNLPNDTVGFWDDAPMISSYSAEDAVRDGVLVDAQVGDYADVTRQHHGRTRVYMTARLHALITRAVENPNWSNDYSGVWHVAFSPPERASG